jgi:hypothetical protein
VKTKKFVNFLDNISKTGFFQKMIGKNVLIYFSGAGHGEANLKFSKSTLD